MAKARPKVKRDGGIAIVTIQVPFDVTIEREESAMFMAAQELPAGFWLFRESSASLTPVNKHFEYEAHFLEVGGSVIKKTKAGKVEYMDLPCAEEVFGK